MATPTKTISVSHHTKNFFRKLTIILALGISTAILLIGSIFFWGSTSLLDSSRYSQTMKQIIQDPVVDQAVATYATEAIYKNIDVQKQITDVLPPKAAFIAPTLAANLKTGINNLLYKVVSNEKFQKVWITVSKASHDKLIDGIVKSHSDGVIHMQDVYKNLAQSFKNSPLSFISDKQLPSDVGSIKLIDASWLPVTREGIKNVDNIKLILIIVEIILIATIMYLAKNKRRIFINLMTCFLIGFILLATSMFVVAHFAVGSVAPTYQASVKIVISILYQPLSSFVSLLTSLLVAGLLIMWLTGHGKNATRLRKSLQSIYKKIDSSITKHYSKKKE